jgi:hypothetical protein
MAFEIASRARWARPVHGMWVGGERDRQEPIGQGAIVFLECTSYHSAEGKGTWSRWLGDRPYLGQSPFPHILEHRRRSCSGRIDFSASFHSDARQGPAWSGLAERPLERYCLSAARSCVDGFPHPGGLGGIGLESCAILMCLPDALLVDRRGTRAAGDRGRGEGSYGCLPQRASRQVATSSAITVRLGPRLGCEPGPHRQHRRDVPRELG